MPPTESTTNRSANGMAMILVNTFLQHLYYLFFQLADKLGVFPAANRGNIRRVMGPIPMGIEEQLDRILSSLEFEATARQKKFLRFVTQMFLEGRAGKINGCTVATEVFGCKTDFSLRLLQPCPSDVAIPGCFEVYNKMHMFGNVNEAKFLYALRISGIISGTPGYASQCLQCGECLEKCPQQIEIPDFLEMVAQELEDSGLEKRVAMGKKMLNLE